VDIDDDGTVRVFGQDQSARDKAVNMIEAITAEAEIGAVSGRVERRYVNTGKDGLLHISQSPTSAWRATIRG
jgi:polyribonucleotide nucleotidyltransferase